MSSPRELSSKRAKNVVIALSLIAAFGVLVYRRVLPLVIDFTSYSDGARDFASAGDPRLRHFVWDAPRPLAQALAGAPIDADGRESSAAWSSDGRWIAFAAGEPGQRDLFVAELSGGAALEVRPLTEINSAADECSPAWSGARLWFASDRAGGAGGYDLYASVWDAGVAGEASAVEGVNSAADDLDPAALANELVFASNRERDGRHDFDLFARALDGSGEVTALTELNSPRDEREPSFASDGRSLFFASDRDGGRGAFDLFRSFEHRAHWLAPHALAELNSERSERAPALRGDALELAFACESADGGDSELLLARSREVARIPGGPSGWYDLALAAALLALAALAALAKRWEQLDFIYKCFLASLVIHLLLMLWFRYLHPEAGGFDVPERGGDTFRVRLLPSEERLRELREREGELNLTRAHEPDVETLERAELEVARAEPAPAIAAALESSAAVLAPAPERAPDAIERSDTLARVAEAELAAPEEQFQRRSGSDVALALDAAATREPARAASSELERTSLERDTTAPAVEAPSAGIVVAKARTGAELDAPTRYTPDSVGPASSAARGVESPELAAPRGESSRRLADAAGDPNVDARSFAAERLGGDAAGAQPTRDASSAAASNSAAREVAASAPGVLDVERSSGAGDLATGFAPSETGPTRAVRAPSSEPALAGPREERPRGALAEAPADALPAPLALGSQRSTIDAAGGRPERLEPSAGSRALDSERANPRAPAAAAPLLAAPRESALDSPRTPPPLGETPYRNRFGPEKEVALQEHGGTPETERAVALGLAYLASRQQPGGSWASTADASDKYRDVRVGVSALSLLAFLGAGHTQASSTEHSRVVTNAIAFLLGAQDETTGHFGNSEAYGHGVATYALAECFAVTRDANLAVPLERAVGQILRHQLTRGNERRAGGWSYYYPDGATFDSFPRTSITSWQVMALESARLGGIDVPDASFAAAHGFLTAAWDEPRGAFRYNHDPQRLQSGYPTLPGSTPAALFALALLGEDLASSRWSAAVDFVMRRAPREFRFAGDDEFVADAAGNLYFWYYGSLALLRHGGDAWERWNEALKTTLLPAQRRDGSWEPIDIYSRYAGDADDDAIYSTAMCVLTLEVYYRYFTPLLRVR